MFFYISTQHTVAYGHICRVEPNLTQLDSAQLVYSVL